MDEWEGRVWGGRERKGREGRKGEGGADLDICPGAPSS